MERINYIDGLKGLSALVVVLGHCCATFWCLLPADLWLLKWPFVEMQNGWLAVQVFVMLSAMLMTYITQDEKRWPKVAAKRYLRFLFPIGLVVIFATALRKLGLCYNMQMGEQIGNEWLTTTPDLSVWQLLKAVVRAPWGGEETWLVMNVVWMLRYVFFCPFIVIILNIATRGMKAWKAMLFVALCMVVSKFYDGGGYIPVFFGYLLVQALPYIRVPNKYWWGQILVFALLYWGQTFLPISNKSLSCVLRTILIVTFVVTCAPAQKVLAWKPFVWLGSISFEVYLLHLIVIYTVACRMYLELPNMPHKMICVFAVVFAITIVLAVLLRYLNKYFEKLTSAIVNWFYAM